MAAEEHAVIAALIDRVTLRLWAWRLRGLRCAACGDRIDKVEVHDDGRRVLAQCSSCDHWSDWRRA